MQSLAWKLAALAGVIGIGFLVMLQAQRGMSLANSGKPAAETNAELQSASVANPIPAKSDAPQSDSTNAVPRQAEPSVAGFDDPEKAPPAAPSALPLKPEKTAPPSATPVANTPFPKDDPFADGTDAKPASKVRDAKKSPADPAHSHIKQVGGISAEHPLKDDAANSGGPGLPAPGSNDAKIDAGQSEPSPEGKTAAGPQLLAPPSGAAPIPAPGGDPRANKNSQPGPGTPSKAGNEPPLFPDDNASNATPPNPKKGGPALGSGESARNPPVVSADASKDWPASDPPAPSGVRAEPAQDFQGDGTVGDTAPLGPQRPQLNIEKIAPQNALIGQPLVYSILVRNIGRSEARDVVVEDRIPKGTKLSGTIPRAELMGKKLVWRLGQLAPGEQKKISIRVVPLEAGEIGSVATVNFVSEAAAETVITAPKLEFKLLANGAARLGEMIPFRFQIKNVGTGEARGLVIRDVIPHGLSHAAGSDLEYEIGRLPAGQSKELTLELKAVKVGTTVNRAMIMGEGGLMAEAKAAIEVAGSKVGLQRTGPARRYLGRPAVYSNTLINESPHLVENIAVAESVPPGMDFAGASHGGQYNEGTRTINWRIERMASGETCILKSKLVPRATGNQPGQVRVTVPHGEPAEAKTDTLIEGFAALGLEVAPLESPIDVGEKLTFRVNARNKGTVAATNVAMTIEIPEQMKILAVNGPGKHSQDGNRLRFSPIPVLDGRTAATCEVMLEARARGDSRLKVVVQADQIEKPLAREESVLVLSESAEPAAATVP